MIKATKLVQELDVPGFVLEQGFKRENRHLRIIGRYCRILQEHVGLRVVWCGFENFFDQLDRLARILL